MVELFANSGDPDQTPRSAASDLGLHCLSIILLGFSRLQWVKQSVPYNQAIVYKCQKFLKVVIHVNVIHQCNQNR